MGTKQGVNFTTTYKNIKLELGSKATQYSPITVTNPNLFTNIYCDGSNEWTTWQPGTGTNVCISLGKIISTKYFKPGNYTISIEISYSNFKPETGKTLTIYTQGTVNNSWNIFNPFANNFVSQTFTGAATFTKKYINTVFWNGNIDTIHDIGFRVNNSDGNGILYWKNLKLEYGENSTAPIPPKQNKILYGTLNPETTSGENGDFYVMY